LLFTDIEGSTRLLNELGAEAYEEALAEHRRLLREAFVRHGGVEVDTQGDAFFYAFPCAPEAVEAAGEGQRALSAALIRVRMGLHTGRPHVGGEGYVGKDVHLGARIAAASHGGQVLVSRQTRALVERELADLGEHRVKDFSEPVWLFQLGEERFPPLKTISNTNLPRPASSFVGREREVSEVASLLQSGARLVTLSGPGGSGKTRLAIESAAELVPEFRNGVFWVRLAALRDPALVAETVAQTLGAKDGLAEHVGERELLLLLDNFEQVVEAAPQLSALLEACPNLRLLVTSRELLRVRAEVEYAVLPLAAPEAVELFCARSRLDPSEEIAELCRRLDDLPLAVELAAARTSVLSPAQILQRVSQRLELLKGGREVEARQRTLRAAIEWSHDLLSSQEETLFRGLAVFAGGCTLEAAEQVCEADLDTLQPLVDKSLLRHTGERFWMLETIREYALERLGAASMQEKLRTRHARFFLALAQEAAAEFDRGEQRISAQRFSTEHANLRAALDHFTASGESQLELRLVALIWEAWFDEGRWQESQRAIERALASSSGTTPDRVTVMVGAAWTTWRQGDAPTGTKFAEESLYHSRLLGDRAADGAFATGPGCLRQGQRPRTCLHLDRRERGPRRVDRRHGRAHGRAQQPRHHRNRRGQRPPCRRDARACPLDRTSVSDPPRLLRLPDEPRRYGAKARRVPSSPRSSSRELRHRTGTRLPRGGRRGSLRPRSAYVRRGRPSTRRHATRSCAAGGRLRACARRPRPRHLRANYSEHPTTTRPREHGTSDRRRARADAGTRLPHTSRPDPTMGDTRRRLTHTSTSLKRFVSDAEAQPPSKHVPRLIILVVAQPTSTAPDAGLWMYCGGGESQWRLATVLALALDGGPAGAAG
jgi:predicted ATPase